MQNKTYLDSEPNTTADVMIDVTFQMDIFGKLIISTE
jgi:hypothetical protein